jgi:membrane-associated phospholipid phosphatase
MLFENGDYGFILFSTGYKITSMPSGHTITAFSIATALYLLNKNCNLKYFYLIFAISIAMSRVVLTSHYLSDVLIGSLIGIWGTIFIHNRFYKTANVSK